ncbi:hypothetical protein MP228_000989 [Amoeboaphelidium protococcarum]|nr:hypothetical protein MP228_000989 [Amoeboaphelidium protococcarum]
MSALLETLLLSQLKYHWPTVVLSFAVWQAVMLASRRVSPLLVPQYAKLLRQKQIQWDIRVVAFLHSVLISALSLVVLNDEQLYRNRLLGYSYISGQVYAIAIGFFTWDLYICIVHYKDYGLGFLVHALSCLLVFLYSMTPFAMYYGAVFLLFELSTPFLNMHWFMIKLQREGSKWYRVNGVLLAVSFFLVRIIYGFYMSFQFLRDLHYHQAAVPLFHKTLYPLANVVLNSLNLFWFSKILSGMFSSIRSKQQ